MSIAVETLASTRRTTKENLRVDQLIPQMIQDKSEKLLELLKDYYSYLNEQNNPTYELASIDRSRDIDETDEQYLDLIQKEIARTLPKATISDRVKLYKNMMRYYSVRGSQDSIELFFKILFDDTVEVYYPIKDVLVPSSGNWDKNALIPSYLDNRGFLSDTIKLQDSYFYQQFSYVIRTGNNVSTWSDAFNRLVHPAGFIFFGEILIIIEGINIGAFRVNSSMPSIQPGLLSAEDYPIVIIIDPIGGTDNTFKGIYYDIVDPITASLAETIYSVFIDVPTDTSGSNMIKYYDMSSISSYRNMTIEDAASGSYIWDDYTIDDVINNSPTWNGVNLGVTLT